MIFLSRMARMMGFGVWVLLFSSAVFSEETLDDTLTQSSAAEEDMVSDVRWYQVELLVFKQRPLASDIPEIWPKDIMLGYPDNWEILKTPDQYQALYQKKPAVDTPFILLEKNKPFAKTLQALQRNQNDILFQAVWRQQLKQNLDRKDDTNSTTILVRGGDSYDDHQELEGSVTLQLSRYLHLDTNLWLSHFVINAPVPEVVAPEANAEPVATWPELPEFPMLTKKETATNRIATTDESTTASEQLPLKKYKVDEIVLNKQSRRMRSNEIHYIDHPKMGILIRLLPLDDKTLLPIPKKG